MATLHVDREDPDLRVFGGALELHEPTAGAPGCCSVPLRAPDRSATLLQRERRRPGDQALPFAFSRSATSPKRPDRKNFITMMTRVANSSMCA